MYLVKRIFLWSILLPLLLIESIIKALWGLVVILFWPLFRYHYEMREYGMNFKDEYRMCKWVAQTYDF